MALRSCRHNQHPGFANDLLQVVVMRGGEAVNFCGMVGLGLVSVDHRDGCMACMLCKVFARVSAQLSQAIQDHLHPFQVGQMVAHALDGTERHRGGSRAQSGFRLHTLAGLEHQGHHPVQPSHLASMGFGQAQCHFQLSGNLGVAGDLRFQGTAHPKQMHHSVHAGSVMFRIPP